MHGVILNIGNGKSAPIRGEIYMPKKLTIEEVADRIKNKFPTWNFKVLDYQSAIKPCHIQCLQCNEIKEYKQLSHLLNKKTPCICTSNASQYKSIQQIKELKQFFNCNDEFELIEWTTMNDAKHKPAVSVYHKKCGRIFTRRTTEFYKNRICPHCDGNAMPDTLEMATRCKEKGYTLLTEYKTLQDKVLIRHDKCGFIWGIKPYRFYKELDGDCPNCNRHISKGERRIMEYLNSKNIQYDREHSFDWQSHKAYRYDYYIPDYNLIIEFHGLQHYEETNFLSSSLETNQEHDKIKMDEALKNSYNYLVIPYSHYSKISEILDNWFNDYPKGVNNKCMVIERNIIFS